MFSAVVLKALGPARTRLAWRRAWYIAMIAALLIASASGCGASGNGGDAGQAGGDAPAREAPEKDAASGEDKGTRAESQPEAPPEASPVETVRVAYEKTVAETARMSFGMDMSGLPEGVSLNLKGEGVVDLGAGTAQMTMRMQPSGAGMPGLGEIQMRQIGNVIYQKLPPQARAGMPEGKTWIRTDLDALMRKQYGADMDQTQAQNGANDLTGQLNALRGVSSDGVEKVGEESVRGAQTTHYRAEIDLEKAAGEDEAAKRAYEQMRKQFGTTKVPVEVWIDRDGLLRRFEMTMTHTAPEQDGSGDVTMTFVQEYYDFGTPVNVQPPPAEKTVDFDQMMSELQGSSQPDA